MGDTTDDLIELSRRITHTPIQREMDMLLSTGERVSMALMSMALNSLHCEAISFTGSQSGVFTDGSHNNARIREIKAFRVKEELEKGKVVIVAGFQGVNPDTKEITTLGRGGSDTTAVALAAHFKAQRCDILTDVRGIFSIDPRTPGVRPRHFSQLNYETTMEMAYWGARVLHYRSVELAQREKVPLLVHLSSEEGSGTLIGDMEGTGFSSVNYNTQVARLVFTGSPELDKCLEAIAAGVKQGNLPFPQILQERQSPLGHEIFLTAPSELFESLHKETSMWCETKQWPAPTLDTSLATVTLTGHGLSQTAALFDISKVLKENSIELEGVMTSALSVTCLVPQGQVQKTAQLLHEKFIG